MSILYFLIQEPLFILGLVLTITGFYLFAGIGSISSLGRRVESEALPASEHNRRGAQKAIGATLVLIGIILLLMEIITNNLL
jgi:accessory gene regulator protein AgrB